jgi:hypothetical protein
MGITFTGRAKRLDDLDLPRIGARIGVDEDVIHAVMEVEARGSGFDRQNRLAMLFEPHVFWAQLGPGEKRRRALARGIAYPTWGQQPYPSDSYPRLLQAMAIDETAALKSASWGLGQIMGFNHKAAGYDSPQAMIAAFVHDEEAHLDAMVSFIKANRLDDELRALNWAGFARGYNGPGFARHNYHGRLAAAYAKWRRIPNTPWTPQQSEIETATNDTAARNVTFPPITPRVVVPPPPDIPKPRPPASAPREGWLARFMRGLRGRG